MTSIRSDYDLMSGLYRLLAQDPGTDLRLLVSGAHLSRNYGRSVELIRKDGFRILAEVESLIDGDSPRSRLKTGSILLHSATDMVANWMPDLLLFAGDREDALIGAMLGTYLQIPTVHFFGGDHEADGHADTAVRHACSKLATAHFVSIEQHRQRLIRMGEDPKRIFVTGNIALDKFADPQAMPRELWAGRFPPEKRLEGYAIVIFHPVDAEMEQCGGIFENILLELRQRGIAVCSSFPNSDPGNTWIADVIRRYEPEPDCWFYRNLDRDFFLSLYKGARFIIGNSSSGIQEAASIPLPAINVGIRQRGRFAGENVIFCGSDRRSIGQALEQAGDAGFQARIAQMVNPYGDGRSCQRAFQWLIGTDFAAMRPKVEDPLDLPRA